MDIKKIWKEIMDELELINRFREKILYPPTVLDRFNDVKMKKAEKNQ